MYKHLSDKKKEFTLSKQCLKSGTSIAAQIREAEFAQSDADFVSKLSIALKEANETVYWLQLLNQTGYLEKAVYNSISSDCTELIKMLTSAVKTVKAKIENNKNKR
jgi:four helix bundle protein